MTKDLWFIAHLLCFQKPVPFYTFTFFLTCSVFFYKLYLHSKTFLNIQAVLGSAVFCSNAVLITTPSFSMQFPVF